MDLFAGMESVAAKEAASSNMGVVFVAPLPLDGVPGDKLGNYVACSGLSVVCGLKSGDIALFDVDDDTQLRLLKLLNDQTDLFAFKPVVLTGMNGVDYPAQFDGAVWQLQTKPFIDLVREADRTAIVAAAENREAAVSSQFAREQQARARRSGHVKTFNRFDKVSIDPSAEDELTIADNEG